MTRQRHHEVGRIRIIHHGQKSKGVADEEEEMAEVFGGGEWTAKPEDPGDELHVAGIIGRLQVDEGLMERD